MTFERRQERSTQELFEGFHISPKVLDREWVRGRLKLEDTKRSKDVKSHLNICPHCRGIKEELENKGDWKSRQIPVGDR